jgi:sugar lactone lactonase YvrE
VVGPDGNVYVAEYGNNRIKVVTPMGAISILAGTSVGFVDGKGTAARLNRPIDVAFGPDRALYVADHENHAIRKVTLDGTVTRVAGSSPGFTDGPAASAKFNYPEGLTVGRDGSVYVADTKNHRIRKIAPDGTVSTLAGSTQGSTDGRGAAAKFNNPGGITISPEGTLYVVEYGSGKIRQVTPEGDVSTVASVFGGIGVSGQRGAGLTFGADGRLYMVYVGQGKVFVIE